MKNITKILVALGIAASSSLVTYTVLKNEEKKFTVDKRERIGKLLDDNSLSNMLSCINNDYDRQTLTQEAFRLLSAASVAPTQEALDCILNDLDTFVVEKVIPAAQESEEEEDDETDDEPEVSIGDLVSSLQQAVESTVHKILTEEGLEREGEEREPSISEKMNAYLDSIDDTDEEEDDPVINEAVETIATSVGNQLADEEDDTNINENKEEKEENNQEVAEEKEEKEEDTESDNKEESTEEAVEEPVNENTEEEEDGTSDSEMDTKEVEDVIAQVQQQVDQKRMESAEETYPHVQVDKMMWKKYKGLCNRLAKDSLKYRFKLALNDVAGIMTVDMDAFDVFVGYLDDADKNRYKDEFDVDNAIASIIDELDDSSAVAKLHQLKSRVRPRDRKNMK